MFCNNCGQEITEGSKFCNGCGEAAPEPVTIQASSSPSPTPEPQPPTPPQRRPSSFPKFLKWAGIGIGGCIGLILVIAIAAAAFEDFTGKTIFPEVTKTPEDSRAQPAPTRIVPPTRTPLPQGDMVGAYTVFQQFVKARLKAPGP